MPKILLSATLENTNTDTGKDAALLSGSYCLMQIEKHDEKNLYCYITENDLHELEIFSGTLAYGSNSFRKLLSVIMKRAGEECRFSSYELPLLVEAVPLENQEFFIQISAIDEAEELDPRFAQFSPSIFEELDLEEEEQSADSMEAPEDIYISEADNREKTAFSTAPDTSAFSRSRRSSASNTHRTIYIFETYEALITALHSAGTADQFSQTRSALYYHPEKKKYYLMLQQQNTAAVRALLASFCEYASARPLTPSIHAWLTEHCRCLIRAHAISRLLEAVS